MKIGFFVDVFYPMVDGVVKVVDHYARELSKDHEVIVFAPRAADKSFKDDYPYQVKRVLKIQVPSTDYDLAIPTLDNKFMQYLNQVDLDIVHIHSPFSMGELGVSYAKKHQKPLYATLHSQYKKDFDMRIKVKPISNLMLKDIIKRLNKCDKTFTMNPNVVDVYLSYGLKKRPHILNNATDLTYQLGHHHIVDLKRDYPINQTSFVMLFVGRIDKIKNIDFIFDVLNELKMHTKDFQMYFVGKGYDLSHYQKEVKKYALENHVYFVGPEYDRSTLAAWYEMSDLFVFPSLYDTNSLVQIEAASQQTPTIFIEGSVTATYIEDDVNGYLESADPIAFARRILTIKNDEAKRKAIGLNARQTLYHSWKEVTVELMKEYELKEEHHE